MAIVGSSNVDDLISVHLSVVLSVLLRGRFFKHAVLSVI